MPLEAVYVCMDCSEYMRNGDFGANRFESQKETAELVFQSKLNGHPETAVGLLTMGLKGKAQVVRSCTTELGELQAAQGKLTIDGECDFLIGLHTAQLALKHRINKNAAQRIVMFVGSPIRVKKKQLIAAGKKLKKNKVSVDIINFGESSENTQLLEEFYKAVKQGDSCNLVTVERGASLAQNVGRSPIILAPEAAAPAAPAAAASDPVGPDGIDPNLDPELAMAIRMSLEESKAREEREAAKAREASAPDANAPAAPANPEEKENTMDANEDDEEEEDDDEEAMLAQALAMSMEQDNEEAPAAPEDPAAQDRDIMEELLDELPGMEKDDVDDLLDYVSDDDDPDKEKDKDKDK